MEKITLEIQNLKCGGCATTITNALRKIEGVSGVEVNDENGTVRLNKTKDTEFEVIKAELRRLGYPLKDEDNPFLSKVKSYASCVVGRMSIPETNEN